MSDPDEVDLLKEGRSFFMRVNGSRSGGGWQLSSLPTHGPLISVVVIAYNRPKMLINVLKTLIGQTYSDLEIIVVLHGATTEVRNVVAKFQVTTRNLKSVSFPINLFDLNELTLMFRFVYKAGFEATSGEYVFFQSDDDFVATDFFSRMARLFIDNPACTTAIGLPQSHYWTDRRIVPPSPGAWMDRTTYMDGREAALFCWADPHEFMPNPGFSYVMRRDEVLKAKYFWGGFELTHLTQVMPFGVTGFDAKAAMFWGRGPQQGNVIGHSMPFPARKNLLLHWIQCNKTERVNAEVMWRDAFGPNSTKDLTRVLRTREDRSVVYLLAESLALGRIPTFLHVLRVAPPSFRTISSLKMWRIAVATFFHRLPESFRNFARKFVPSSVIKKVLTLE